MRSKNHRLMLLGIRVAAACVASLSAAHGAAQTPVPPAQKLDGIVVESSTDTEKRDSVAAKTIVTRAEIIKFGDSSILGVLARIPGVSVGGGVSNAGEVGLRGLGSGYVQIQVNGEPVAAGFSLDSLSPELVERIEISTSARADSGAQAVAGTINIVLRRIPSTAQRELKANIRDTDGRLSGGLSGQWSDKIGLGSYAVTASADVTQTPRRWSDTFRATTPAGLLFDRQNRTFDLAETKTITVVPRANFKLDDETALSFDALAQVQTRDYQADQLRFAFVGTPPSLAADVLNLTLDTTSARATAGLKTGTRDKGLLDGKLTVSTLERSGAGVVDGFDVARTRVLIRAVTTETQERAASTNGSYSHSLIGTHALTVGWNAQLTRRSDTRIQRDQVFDTRIADNRDERYTAEVGNLALFAQDEWDISPAASAYLGVRWEGLTTDTEDLGTRVRVRNRSSVFSPSAQLSYKLTNSPNDRIKLALTRAYTAPTAVELIPRRWTVFDNTATTANFQGNPTLIPELAWGLDASYEKYLANKQSFTLSLYVKRIENVIVPFTFLAADRLWVKTPQNTGAADLAGIDATGKFKLQSLIAGAPEIDLRPSLNLNRSNLRAVPGPNSRLNLQPKYSVGLGADYRAKTMPVSFGGDFKYAGIGLTTDALFQTRGLNDRRTLDTHATWSVQKGMWLKLSGLNLLARADVEPITYTTASLTQRQVQTQQIFRTVRLEGSVQW